MPVMLLHCEENVDGVRRERRNQLRQRLDCTVPCCNPRRERSIALVSMARGACTAYTRCGIQFGARYRDGVIGARVRDSAAHIRLLQIRHMTADTAAARGIRAVMRVCGGIHGFARMT